VIIFAKIFVAGNQSLGQTTIYFYCAPWMAVFELGVIEALYFMTGTWMGRVIASDSVTVRECFYFNCKLDLQALQGNLNGFAYHNNLLNVHVVPH
jgi:hypothetical protein